MYYRLLEDHRFPLIEFHTSSCKSQGSLAPSLTTESRLSPGDDFLGIYLGAPTRAHTLTRMHQGRGRRGGTFGAGPLFQPLLLSQVTVPPSIVQADFTIYSAVRESTSEGEKVWQIFRPKENFGRHTIHLPGHLDYHLICRLYMGVSLHLRCLWDLENDRWGHTKAPDAMIGRAAKLSKSQLPCKQLFTARCRTFLQGVGVLTTTRGRGETYIVLQLSSSSYLPTENIW